MSAAPATRRRLPALAAATREPSGISAVRHEMRLRFHPIGAAHDIFTAKAAERSGMFP